MARIYGLLSRNGLLPHAANIEERTARLNELDSQLAAGYGIDNLPYFLRAKALDAALQPYEAGRAIYHLAQRRGFLSNRKSVREPEEERGRVKAGITSLTAAITDSKCRTLGEFLAKQDPHAARIRGRYTSRSMYLHEFECIWVAQAKYCPGRFTDELRAKLVAAMFFQRPLRDQSDLIGDCMLEPARKRSPLWHPLVQRFRLLQEVNNVRIVDSSGLQRPLDHEERGKVIARLENGDLPLREFRALLGLRRGIDVNLDRGGKQSIIGNRTESKLRSAFGARWEELNDSQRLEAIIDLTSDLTESDLSAKAIDRWSLDKVRADAYAEIALEAGKYAAYSLEAISRLMPHLEGGEDVTTARATEYPETFRTDILDQLPPAADRLRDLRNPAVVRTLTEVRKVMNALIRRFGKPSEIHIELARELKATRGERENRWKQMRQNETERAAAAKALLAEVGLPNASRNDVEKWLLADECNWQCPYTGRSFSKQQLFHTGEVHVEHIIPFSRSLDDSFLNKTLAFASANDLKGNRGPQEAFAATAEWDDMLARVEKFNGPHRRVKLRRFKMTTGEIQAALDNFTSRQLNDTRYASRLAARYLACLYGGLWDDSGQRIFVSPGQVTARLRRLWAIEGILGGNGKKSRDDHRHHAVDAIVIGLTGPKWVKALCDAAARATHESRNRIASIEAPWAGFAGDVRAAIAELVVSHRADRRISGAMHDETLYGQISLLGGGKATVVRKPVHRLSAAEVEHIVDPAVRHRVHLQLGIVGGDAKKLEATPPMLEGRNGAVPIRKVRIAIPETPRVIAEGSRSRSVLGGDYHHFEIIRRAGLRDGKKKWIIVPVSMQDAMSRLRGNCPVVSRTHGPLDTFVCSIAKGDTIQLTQGGETRLVTVQALEATTNRIGFKSINDARPYGPKSGNRERCSIATFMDDLKASKVTITPTGEIRRCND